MALVAWLKDEHAMNNGHANALVAHFWRSPMRPAWHDGATVQNVQESQRIRDEDKRPSVWGLPGRLPMCGGAGTPRQHHGMERRLPQWHCPKAGWTLRVGGWAFFATTWRRGMAARGLISRDLHRGHSADGGSATSWTMAAR